MAEVVVVGAFTAKPGQEQAAQEAFEALVAPTHGESGCILYSLHRGADDPALPYPLGTADELDRVVADACAAASAARAAPW